MAQKICVYASSSEQIDGAYKAAAGTLGRLMAQDGHTLVYGGGKLGLMGAVARAVHAEGGQVIGVIPEKLTPQAYDADEVIVTETMRERKAHMEALADAFIVLPGGFGTLEEALEIITLKQLQYHNKPLALVNTASFFDPLLAMFDHILAEGFALPAFRTLLYHVAPTPADALDYLTAYQPSALPDKWPGALKPADPLADPAQD